jgi:outer membrane protein TolC
MKKQKIFLSILLLLFFSINSLVAQTLELDINKAQKIALENNIQYKLAEEALSKAKAQVTIARGGMLPSLSAFSQYQRAWELPTVIFDDPFSDGKIEFKMGTEHSLIYGLSFQQPIFLGGAIWNGYKMAKHGYTITEASLESTRQSVLLQSTSAYYGLLFSKSVVRVMEQAYETAQENLDQVNKIRSVGQASDFDVLRAEVQLANLKPTLTSAKNNSMLAESKLSMILGLDNNPKIITLDSLTFAPHDFSGLTVEDLNSRALQNRPDIKIMDEQKRIMQRRVTLARSAILPSLVFGTNYQFQGQRDDLDFTGDDFFKAFNSSISLSVPLFTGFQKTANIQQAKAGVREAGYQIDALYQAVNLEIETAYLAITEKEQSVATQSKIIDQAKEALRLARLRYAEGLSTQLDLMYAEGALNQARMNYQQSLFDYNIAIAQLKKALNEL